MKTCTKCLIPKELSDFSTDKTKSDGFHSTCKICDRAYQKIHRKSPSYIASRHNPSYIAYCRAYDKKWKMKYRKTEKYAAWRKATGKKLSIKNQELKKLIVAHYGGKCACCPVSEDCFLTLHHINNDGYKLKERKDGTKAKERFSGYRW